jgi:hypothetical protein
MKLKMYVWVDPYSVLYGTTKLIAVAKSIEEARKLACSSAAPVYAFGKYQQERPPMTVEQLAVCEPERVVDLPYAEWDSVYE